MLLNQKVANESSISRIIHMYIIPFWFHCITIVQTLHPKYGYQLFMLTLNLQFHGLSRFGMNLLGLCHAASSIRTYDRWRTGLLVRYDLNMQSIIETGTFCWIWDNYAHVFRNARLTTRRKFLLPDAN